MISSIIHPFDRHLLEPELSPNGKYIFRMHFNGCFRKVTIDDRLPTSRNEQTLHVMDRNSPGLLWPALIEKAYLKVRGGYDFPGSNSGTDIWVLTSWIPEQIFLQRYGFVHQDRLHDILLIFREGTISPLVDFGAASLVLSIMVMYSSLLAPAD